jgi:hypothetical protein
VASSRRMRWTGAVLSAGVLMVDGGEVWEIRLTVEVANTSDR